MKLAIRLLIPFCWYVFGQQQQQQLLLFVQAKEVHDGIYQSTNHEDTTEQRELRSPLSDFLDRFEVCEKVGTNSYKTVKVSRANALMLKLRRRATDGPCDDCSVLCKHEACKGDYDVSLKDGTEICTCLEGTEVKDTMCGTHSTCSDDVCSCLDGFVGDAKVACVDVDECTTSTTGPCGANTKCTNVDGAFKCECMDGYTGDVIAGCVDINECDNSGSATKTCGDNTSCINVGGTFECKCLEGYEGDPKVGCTDINECATNTTICSSTVQNSYCSNIPGSYECLCRKGFELNPSSNKCLSTKSCWGDGEACQYGSTCNKCCQPASYWWDLQSYACSFNQPCWEDGKDCIPGVTCGLCCNTAYDNQGTKCGGECYENGKECGFGTSCDLCCEGFSWKNDSVTVCGKDECWDDGTNCVPLGSCGQCCNDAFDNLGRTCGGECWNDGRKCDVDSTCELCCEFPNFWPDKNATACGKPPCLKDGVKCGDDCLNCCNTAYDDKGTTCGGECWTKGRTCKPFETCELCCGKYKSYLPEDDKVVCGRGNFTTECLEDGFNCGELDVCWQCCSGPFDDPDVCGGKCLEDGTECTDDFSPDFTCKQCCTDSYYYDDDTEKTYCGYEEYKCLKDGTACIPGQDCWDCCNGSYLDGGYKCGGKCLKEGTECAYGKNCHLCCYNDYNFWYSNNNFTCGYEPCFDDGTPCIPGTSCEKCCNGSFDDNGFTCGGDCIKDGKECDIFTTCPKCCSENYKYNEEKERVECASNSTCIEDGDSCIPRDTCYNCCSGGGFLDDGLTCGGECLEGGTECNYFTTCNLCCTWPQYDEKLKKHICFDFGGYDDDYFDNDDDWTGFDDTIYNGTFVPTF